MGNRQNKKSEQFARDGFYVFQNVIEPALVDQLNAFCDGVLAQQDPEHFKENVTTGSMVMINWEMAYQNAVMAKFIAHPKVIGAMNELGFPDPKFGHGRIITKPPHSPQLFWHEDGRFWDDPVSYSTQPIQVFLMFYLVDTTPQNGCLRVIPGSHLKRHPLHDMISPRHTEETKTYANRDNPAFLHVNEEIDVPLKAGDLVMGYGSLLHASHANQSDERRTVLTMWYYPDYVDLPDRTQATVAMVEKNNRDAIPTTEETRALLDPLKIEYNGNAEPIEPQLIPIGLK